MLLSGGTPGACWKDLAHAWGREYGFHSSLVTAVFDRHGNVERKRRNDSNIMRGKRKQAKEDNEENNPLSVTHEGDHDDMVAAVVAVTSPVDLQIPEPSVNGDQMLMEGTAKPAEVHLDDRKAEAIVETATTASDLLI